LEGEAFKAANEMLRIAKPGGRIFIGNVNDKAKLGVADCMGTQRLFLDKSMWYRFAKDRSHLIDKLEIVDGYDIWHKTFGYDMAARFR